ncbi:MAG: hypothetical protein GXP27_17510, partial [Planctomycetes bacterium]|nr:hypothetical protein [Planctomycetota bacterium]
SIETVLRANGYQGRITGCDVSLYTCALGAYFAGWDLPVRLNEAAFPELAPLEPFLSDAEGRAAAVAVALDALAFAKRRNDYQKRMWDAYVRRLPELCERTRARLRQKRDRLQLDAYHAQDAWERVERIPPGDDHVILTFPPTYAGGYEKLYDTLHRAFHWPQPKYRELTSGEEFARRVIDRPGPWIIGAEKPTPELEKLLGKPVAITPPSIFTPTWPAAAPCWSVARSAPRSPRGSG